MASKMTPAPTALQATGANKAFNDKVRIINLLLVRTIAVSDAYYLCRASLWKSVCPIWWLQKVSLNGHCPKSNDLLTALYISDQRCRPDFSWSPRDGQDGAYEPFPQALLIVKVASTCRFKHRRER